MSNNQDNARATARRARRADADHRLEKKDIWERRKILASWVAAIAVPLALGIGGWLISLALKERESGLKFIELSVAILSSEPKPFDDHRALRKWAVDTLSRYSIVPLPDIAKNGLANTLQLTGKGQNADIGITLSPLDSRRGQGFSKELTFGNLVTDAVRASFDGPRGADFAVITTMSFRGQKLYPAGTKLTRKDIIAELPFANSVQLVSISGSELLKAIERASNRNGDIPQVSGLAIRYSERENKIKIDSLFAKGDALTPTEMYRVATTDFDALSLPEFRDAIRVQHSSVGRHISDIIIMHMYDEKSIQPMIEGRISKSPQ